MHYNYHLGLHLPLRNGLDALIDDIRFYQVRNVQFFLAPSQRTSTYIKPTSEEVKRFNLFAQDFLDRVIVHSSYWINPSIGNDFRFDIAKSLLQKEIMLAQKLGVKQLVLHPGSATWFKPNQDDPRSLRAGIERIAALLNELLAKHKDVEILLENTAHAGKTIGSDLHDFLMMRELFDYPERIGYCVDLAHAFAYGYALDKPDFLDLLDRTMGLSSIKLIHFNDSYEEAESQRDRHALPGLGLIGKPVLQGWLRSPAFQTIPKIIEVTNLTPAVIRDHVALVSSW